MNDTAVTPTTDTPTLPPHPETALPVTDPDAIVDGDAPRLGGGPLMAPGPIGTPTVPTGDAPPVPVADLVPNLPASAPVLPTAPAPVAPPPVEPALRFPDEQYAQNAMQIDVASLPRLPVSVPAVPSVVDDHAPSIDDDQVVDLGVPEHPMAHLMPARSKPNEASIRAAEQRAIKKAKATKIKIGVFVGALAVSVLAGPPFVSWLTGAINEAGNTSTESSE